MPRITRSQLAPRDEIGIYHCYNRTIGNVTLCGVDPVTKIDYSGRVTWMLELLQILAATMLVDLLRVSFMRNHYHLMLRTRPDLIRRLSNHEVVQRMVDLSPDCLRKNGRASSPAMLEAQIEEAVNNAELVEEFRQRLANISWLMKMFGQHLAQRINRELDRKGPLFEGRFNMNRLESPAAVLACALYIDLNPIRAGRCTTPEESLNTSIYLQIIGRMQRARRATEAGVQLPPNGDLWLDTVFAATEDADAWLAPTMLDPEHRLHHQVHRWRAEGSPKLDHDLTGNDPNLREFLQLVERFEWVVGRGATRDPAIACDDPLSEFDPKALQRLADQFEQLLARLDAADRIASECQATGAESSSSPAVPRPSATAAHEAGTMDGDATAAGASSEKSVPAATRPLGANPQPELVGSDSRTRAAASEQIRADQLQRVRMVIASCRRQLKQLIEVPEVVRSYDPDGSPTTLHRRLAAILKRCQPQSPQSMLDCNRRGNHYPSRRASNKGFLPITSEEYMVILDQTGRLIRSDKPGAIPAELPPILERLGLRSSGWYGLMVDFEKHFGGIVGSAEDVTRRRRLLNHKKIHGLKEARQFFESVVIDELTSNDG